MEGGEFGGRRGRGKGVSEVDFGGDEVKRLWPLIRSGVTDEKGEGWERCILAVLEPSEVFGGVIDHFGGEVGTKGGKAHEECFLKKNAGAAKGVEKDLIRCGGDFGGGEVDENLSEFGGKHTNKGATGGASLVAFGIGGNVLGAD